jgi:putative protein-disulfide isomerase
LKVDLAPELQAAAQTGPAKLKILYFTDPSCSWCWATEPVIKKICEEYSGQVRVVYKMGGLLESWDRFRDSVNRIGRPEDVAPHWVAVGRRSGMPIDERIWYQDPPASTFPGCVAYKAGWLQDERLAELYLRRLREAVLTERRNIAREHILFDLAREVGFDLDRFHADFLTGQAQQAFYEDLTETRSRGITAFPALVISNSAGRETVLIGYRPYSHYESALRRLAVEELHKMPLLSLVDFIHKYHRVATQEVAVVYDLDRQSALKELNSLAVAGLIARESRAGGEFWKVAPEEHQNRR